MAKNTDTHDADYDRWGRTPGSIKITKPVKKNKKSVTKPKDTRSKKK